MNALNIYEFCALLSIYSRNKYLSQTNQNLKPFKLNFTKIYPLFLPVTQCTFFNVSEFKPSLEFCTVGSGVYPWSLPWYTLLIYLKIDCLPDGK